MFSAALKRRQQVERLEHEPDPLAADLGELAVAELAEVDVTCGELRNTLPDVSVSSPARACIRVLLPDPDGPMIAVKRRAGRPTLTPSRARTSVPPRP